MMWVKEDFGFILMLPSNSDSVGSHCEGPLLAENGGALDFRYRDIVFLRCRSLLTPRDSMGCR